MQKPRRFESMCPLALVALEVLSPRNSAGRERPRETDVASEPSSGTSLDSGLAHDMGCAPVPKLC